MMTEEEQKQFHDLGNLAAKYQSKMMQAERALQLERARSEKLIAALEQCEDIACDGSWDRDERVRDTVRAAITEDICSR